MQTKRKRMRKVFASALIAMLVLSIFPVTSASADIEREYVSNDFEANYDGWTNKGDYTLLTALTDYGHNDSRGMYVSNRITEDCGVYSQKGLYLDGGNEYTYSIYVRHDSDTTETFQFDLRYLFPNGETYETVTLVSQEVLPDEWTRLEASYTAPIDSVNLTLILTTNSTTDFYFDDVLVTGKPEYSTSRASTLSTNVGLKNIYTNYFRVGTCISPGVLNDTTTTALILKEYNSITHENELKPDATLVQATSSNNNIGVSLSRAASILNFCAENSIAVRGHTLVWHSQTPEWFFKDNFNTYGNWVSSSVMDQRMESYIKNMFEAIATQYPTLNLYAYDVVNEAISDDYDRTANHGGARVPGYGDGKSPWVQVYGNNSFIEKAFTYARRYAPEECSLFYNDYNEYWDHKRDSIIATIINPLYGKGVLDGMGMQSHINANMDGFTGMYNYKTAFDMYAAIGCEVQITELDISTENGSFSDEQQAEKYKAIFELALNAKKAGKNITAVCVWGPNDANTWLGSENTPLLHNRYNQPKAAYYAVASLVPESEWGDGGTIGGPSGPNEFGWYFQNSFEGSVDNWQPRGGSSIQTSGRTAYVGNESLLVQDRTASWNGACKVLDSRTFIPGNEYSFSVNAMYYDGAYTEDFYLKLQYTDAAGNTQYSTIAEATAIQGEWAQLANTNYQIPYEAKNMQLYVETAESTHNFYIDEAIGAVAGTHIIGADSQQMLFIEDTLEQQAEPVASIMQTNPTDYMNWARSIMTENEAWGITNQYPGVDYGTLAKKTYYSTTAERVKKVNVLLPAGYTENKRYPVLYALHGYWGDEDALLDPGDPSLKLQNIIGNLTANGEAKEMIVVFPSVYTSKDKEFCTGLDLENSLNYDNFINDLVNDLMPYISSNYSIATGRENTAIAGFSMGGRESLFIGLTRSDLFGYVGAVCPAPGLTPGWDLALHPGQLQEYELRPNNAADPYLIMVSGALYDDVVNDQPKRYHEILNRNGVDHLWHEIANGNHAGNSIRPHIYNFARMIFQVDGTNEPGGPNEYGWYFQNSFEGSLDDWQPRGDVNIMTSGRTAYVGNESLLVHGRTDTWNGTCKILDSRTFLSGNEYSFSVNAIYYDGAYTEDFYLKLQYTDAAGNTQYSTIAEATAINGEWVQLANTNYQIPYGATNLQLYVETAQNTSDFYIDEAIGAVGGTFILGAGSQ